MKLSVVVGTLNVGGSNLERLVKSVIGQNYDDKELIIIDGGSTDDTLDIIKKYASKIAYWVSEPDGGLVEAYNKGLAVSTGDYVGFMGGSDWFYNDVFLEIKKTYIETNADVIYGDVSIEMQDGSFFYRSSKDADLESLYYSSSAFCTAGTFARRELYNILYGSGIAIANDAYLWGSLYRMGKKFAYVDCGHQIANFSYGGVSTTKQYPLWKDVRRSRLMVIEDSPHLKEKWLPRLNREYGRQMHILYKKIILPDEYVKIIGRNVLSCDGIVIFGAGRDGDEFGKLLIECGKKVLFFVDSNSEKQGTFLNGIEVKSVEYLKNLKNTMVFIASSYYEEEILEKVKNMNLDNSIIIDTASDLLYRVYQDIGDEVLEKAYRNKEII